MKHNLGLARFDGDEGLVRRYLAGEHAAVWSDVRRFDCIGGAYREDVLEVARETMRAVRHNVDLLASRLLAEGWSSLGGALRTTPSNDDTDAMAELERVMASPLPPSVRAFWEVVGAVDFIYQREGNAPDFGLGLDLAALDPLALDPASVAARSWFEQYEDEDEDGATATGHRYLLELAPDYLHKANISGGIPYGIELPFLGADPPLVNEEHLLGFVDYLRLCLRWAGFPRLQRHADHPGVGRFVTHMTAGMRPF